MSTDVQITRSPARKQLNVGQAAWSNDYLGTQILRDAQFKEFEAAIVPAKVLAGAASQLSASAKQGGIDRGFDGVKKKGTGKFGKMLPLLKTIETPMPQLSDSKSRQKAAALRKSQASAMVELERLAVKYIAADDVAMTKKPKRIGDPVSIRKKQFCEVVVAQAEAKAALDVLSNADVADLPEATRRAEAAVRKVDAAVLAMKSPPKRIGGDKGNSDSFRIMDGAKTKFIFKPQDGEAVAAGWPPGGGALREVLISQFNDQMQAQFGLNFGVAKTTTAQITAEAMQGKNLKPTMSRSCVGVILDAFQNATDAEEQFKTLASQGGPAVKAFKDSIEEEDVHNIALLDFMTLNMDRNPGNAMFFTDSSTLKTRMVPIDAGNMLPPEAVFDDESGSGPLSESMTSPVIGDEDPISLGNVIMQLPQAQQPFNTALLAKIQAMDPRAVARGLREADGKQQGNMAGKIGEDTFQLVEESVHFLKMATALTPTPTVRELGILYAIREGFKQFKAMRRVILAKSTSIHWADFTPLAAELSKAMVIARQRSQAEANELQFMKLGGRVALEQLGWEFTLLSMTECIDKLAKKTQNPAAIQKRNDLLQQNQLQAADFPNNFATLSIHDQINAIKSHVELLDLKQQFDAAGGAVAFKAFIAEAGKRNITATAFKLSDNMDKTQYQDLLRLKNAFEAEGGFAAFDKGAASGHFDPPINLEIGSVTTRLKDIQKLAHLEAHLPKLQKLAEELTARGIKNANVNMFKEPLKYVDKIDALQKGLPRWNAAGGFAAFDAAVSAGKIQPEDLAHFAKAIMALQALQD